MQGLKGAIRPARFTDETACCGRARDGHIHLGPRTLQQDCHMTVRVGITERLAAQRWVDNTRSSKDRGQRKVTLVSRCAEFCLPAGTFVEQCRGTSQGADFGARRSGLFPRNCPIPCRPCQGPQLPKCRVVHNSVIAQNNKDTHVHLLHKSFRCEFRLCYITAVVSMEAPMASFSIGRSSFQCK